MTDLDSILRQQTRRRLDGFIEAAEDAGMAPARPPGFWAAMERVFEASGFMAGALTRRPGILDGLLRQGLLLGDYGPGELDRLLALRLAHCAGEADLGRRLRRFREEQMVRIVWRDLAGWASLAETLEDLSALADACILRALERLYPEYAREHGLPLDARGRPQSLLILAMGKLGARELNLSSDIDLIFLYPGGSRVSGGPLDAQRWFEGLARRLVRLLERRDEDGFVFRVDTRLRPFGRAGPLAMSLDAYEDYLQTQAREWERYALVKARILSPGGEAASRLGQLVRAFVYRRYLDFGAIRSLRGLKAMIDRELHEAGLERDIKRGRGGIREVEFIGQVFQIARGGRDPELQVRPILEVLRRLGAKGLLPEFAVRELSDGYRFLRRVENRLQAWRDEQTHRLPEDDLERLRLARAMGFARTASFERALNLHRRRIQAHFDQVFASPQGEPRDSPIERLWHQDLDSPEAIRALKAAGFADPLAAEKRLRTFREGILPRVGERGRERLDRLLPLFLQALGATPGADLGLARGLSLIEAVARRTAYLDLLVEHPLALSQLARLLCLSPWVAERLSQHPLLLDELLDPRRLYAPLERAALDAELEALLGGVPADDLEQQMERLRQFAQGNQLRVAAADLTGAIPVTRVSDYLTWIAEAVLEQALRLAWNHLVRTHGPPQGLDPGGRGFLILGYGKLGGMELGYGSDLDLVFLHKGAGQTRGPRPVSHEVFFARLGQRIIHLLTTRTPSGILYEVDMRLRPDGQAGLLATSLEAYARYQQASAWTWEHQALVRARALSGDPRLAEGFARVRRAVLTRRRDPDTLRREVREMRERMRAHLDRSDDRRFDLKQGRGGIADLEFMVQFWVLRLAHAHPELIRWSDNLRQLEALGRLGLIPRERATALAEAYQSLRAAYHRDALQEATGLISSAELGEARRLIAGTWREWLEPGRDTR